MPKSFFPNRRLVLRGAALLVALVPQALTRAWAQPRAKRDVRYVIFNRPGPAWQADKGPFDQPGIPGHLAHYRRWLDAGKLELGGPHLDADSGGLMIPAAGVSEEEVRRHVLEDPAVKDGTLIATVRPWLIGMAREPKP